MLEQNNTCWRDLIKQTPFNVIQQLSDTYIDPTKIEVHGLREITFSYVFESKGGRVTLEAVWSFVWGRFYFIKNVESFYATGSYESPLLTEDEFIRDIRTLILDPDLILKEESEPSLPNREELAFLIGRFES